MIFNSQILKIKFKIKSKIKVVVIFSYYMKLSNPLCNFNKQENKFLIFYEKILPFSKFFVQLNYWIYGVQYVLIS